ncbi:MAG: hypothetical protein KatS3mg117_0357 [Geminicoccaceae bacterium]|nr:MAG: hypothetical protein KatS3mg117_0357 [Geminicoccaceae bacterium]
MLPNPAARPTTTARPRSPAQIEAARRNGARSRGPVTAAGKARAARNALRHGLCSATMLAPGEDSAAFEALLAELRAELAPASHLETLLVERLALTFWKLARCDRLEATLATIAPRNPAGRIYPEPGLPPLLSRVPEVSLLLRYQSQLGRDLQRFLRHFAEPPRDASSGDETAALDDTADVTVGPAETSGDPLEAALSRSEPEPPTFSPAGLPPEPAAAAASSPNEPEPDPIPVAAADAARPAAPATAADPVPRAGASGRSTLDPAALGALMRRAIEDGDVAALDELDRILPRAAAEPSAAPSSLTAELRNEPEPRPLGDVAIAAAFAAGLGEPESPLIDTLRADPALCRLVQDQLLAEGDLETYAWLCERAGGGSPSPAPTAPA